MATHKTDAFRHQIFRTFLPDSARATDAQFLDRFVDHQDEDSFAALLKQHGPMVWGVCCRLLGHHDAEDAFQTTFLVLVRKAHAIRPRGMVANWLYGVAHRTALQVRRTATKRKAREGPLAEPSEPEAAEQDTWSDLLPVLDRELSRLPARYRTVIVLCDLERKTRKEAARELGLPAGTVASRLMRARAMLAKRLLRHGRVVPGGAVAAVLAQNLARAAAPHRVVSSTLKAASLLATGHAVRGAVPADVAALFEGVTRAMLLSQIKTLAALSLGLVLAFATAALGSGRLTPGSDATEPPVVVNDPPAVPSAPSPPAGTEGTPRPKRPGADELPELNKHLTAWEKRTDGITNWRADVALKRTDATTKTDLEYTGAVLCMKPNLSVLRIDHAADKNAYEAYIYDGTTRYVYSGKDKSIAALQLPMNRAAAPPFWTNKNPALGLLTGVQVKGLKERYEITRLKADEGFICLRIKPRLPDDRREFQSLRLTLHSPQEDSTERAYLPAKLHVLRPNGDEETWTFTNTQIDVPGVSETNFKFVSIKGWKVERVPTPQTHDNEP